MRVHQFFDMSRKPPVGELPEVPGSDARRERTVQRLQIGITGIVMMILLVGLASIIQNRAAETDATTTEPTQAAPQNDPLVEAGVVPDLPAEPSATPNAAPTSGPQTTTDAPPPAAN
jgi:type IV secretory pathway VirB10-like protein